MKFLNIAGHVMDDAGYTAQVLKNPDQQNSQLALEKLIGIEVVMWALAYLLVLPGDHLATFERATYFSVVTFTTLGYGDITLVDHDWRMLSGIEALFGVILIGWSTALLFLIVQRSWRNITNGP